MDNTEKFFMGKKPADKPVEHEDLQKVFDMDVKELPSSPEHYKVGAECPLYLIVKVVGERKDMGESHVISFKVVSVMNLSGAKKYKNNRIY
jgi:hypothetical protein